MPPLKPWLFALAGGASVLLLLPSPGRAQPPGQSGFANGSDFRQYDASLSNYAGQVQGGVNGPDPLNPLAPTSRFSPLTTPGAIPQSGLLPFGTTYSAFPDNVHSPGGAGRLVQSWVYRPGLKYFYAVALSSNGLAYHWICWPARKDYYYLFDPVGAKYIGVHDRLAGIYRPYDSGAQQWGAAISPPVPAPSQPPPGLTSRDPGIPPQRPGNSTAARQPRVQTGSRPPATKADSVKSGP